MENRYLENRQLFRWPPRRDAGLTQAELATRISRNQSHVSLIDGSHRRPDLVEFHVIARALGRDPVELFAAISAALDAAP